MVLEDDSKSHDELKGIVRKFVILYVFKSDSSYRRGFEKSQNVFLFSNMYPICIKD